MPRPTRLRSTKIPSNQSPKSCILRPRFYSKAPLATGHELSVLITGGSRGIGLAIAKQFAQHPNVHTSIVGRDESTLRSATQSIADSSKTAENPNNQPKNVQHSYIVGDVTSREFWESLSRRDFSRATISESSSSATASGWDVVVNAAGVSKTGVFARQTAHAIEHVFQTNLMGTTWACRYMIPAMLKRARSLRVSIDSGNHPGMCIVNVSSLLGLKGGTGSAAYAASKAGVLGLTRALAAEYGPLGLRINALVPGYVETAMTDAMDPKARDLALQSIPLKRFGTVDEIASAAVFLATNRYANNCVLNLDGGLSAT
ncbi:hypothetical protein IWZ00DRAFT_543834 [Phyllosticta capitalensis]